MNPPIVIKQGNTLQQGSIQPTMVTVPMNSINSSMPGSIPNVMTLAKPGGQNVVVTSQNLAGTSQPTMMPNVQIVNMRPGAPGMSAQKSVATVSPRVVIGSPQVVGTRGAAPGITLQALQGLQSGQQGHLLLKTENGQYQLLRVGPAPAGSGIAAPQGQTIRLSTVPAQPGMATMSTSMAAPPQLQTMSVAQAATPVVNATVASNPTPTVTTQKPSDNTKEKCRNFLANLLDLSSKEPKSVETNVRNLIQELIDGHVEPEAFCDRLERLLNASPQPCLIGFLKKSLPLLRQSLITKELVIEGINPPSPHMAFGSVTVPAQPVILPNIQMFKQHNNNNFQQHIQQQQQQLQQQLHQQQQKPPGKSISVLQNIPIQAQKINLNRVASPKTAAVKLSRSQVAAPLSTVLTPGKSLLREKERDKEKRPQFSQQQFADDKMGGDDDINDVAAMGGVNLAEESQRILGSTEQIGTQIRSCKEEYLVPSMALQARIKAMMQKRGMEEPSPDVTAILNHALHERLKSVVEKLAVTAQHRIDVDIKTDPRYEVTQDVKGQLKFLEELDRVEKKKREDSEREMLLRAAKSRSKNEDPEQAKLKAKAKEMQRVELEEMRQREANHTALQAIGPRKKPRLDAPGGGDAAPGAPVGAQVNRTQLALRTRLKRICQRDFLFLMEQERETSRSHALYKFYLQ